MNDNIKNDKNQIVFIEYLRVICCIAVVFLHVSGHNWSLINVTDCNWVIFNIYNGCVRWAVPVFVMISGALFLDRNVSINKLYIKYIIRLCLVYLFWNLFYAIIQSSNIIDIINKLIEGHYHMWFIPMIIGMYAVTPFLRNIVQDSYLFKYALLLSFIYSVIVPTLLNLYRFSRIDNSVLNSFEKLYSNINLNFGYIFYFILGYYLYKYDIDKRKRYIFYVLGIVSELLSIVIGQLKSIALNTPVNIYSNFIIFTVFEAIALFLLVKSFLCKKKKIKRFVKSISSCSLGIYILHAFFIEHLAYRWNIDTLSFNAVISVPFITLVVFGISFVIVLGLRKLYIFKKYLL